MYTPFGQTIRSYFSGGIKLAVLPGAVVYLDVDLVPYYGNKHIAAAEFSGDTKQVRKLEENNPPKGTPATLLRYMYDNRIFSDNPKKSSEMALQRGGNDSLRTIQRELQVLREVGLVLVDRTGYYLPERLREVDLEKITEENTELEKPNPNQDDIDRIKQRIAKYTETLEYSGTGEITDALDRASVEKIVAIDAKEATNLTDNNALQLIRRSRTSYFIFEFYRNRNTNKIQITIQPIYRKEEIWRDPIWKMRQELKRHIPYLSPQEILTIINESNILILGSSATLTDAFNIFFINSRREFDKKTKQYFTGERIYDLVKNMLSSPDYSHIDLFRWIHTYEAKELEHILQENSGKVSVLDIGAGFADFILTSHLLLKGYEDRISYVGVDISEANLKPAINHSKGLTDLSVQFLICDIQYPEFRNRVLAANRGKRYDLVVANHIAEHLEEKAIVDSLWEWLSITRRLLIVSLPIEENLGTGVSLHQEQITLDSLIGIGRRIEQAIGNKVIADVTHVDSGILTLRRVEFESHPDNDSPNVKSSGLDTATSSPTTEGKYRLGGIDFHALPIVTQPINTPAVTLTAIPVNRLSDNGLDSEWSEIQNMLNAGIIPSSQRIKEYFEDCCQKNRLNTEMDNVLNCIADIMRIEEERVLPTDPTFKDLLILIQPD